MQSRFLSRSLTARFAFSKVVLPLTDASLAVSGHAAAPLAQVSPKNHGRPVRTLTKSTLRALEFRIGPEFAIIACAKSRLHWGSAA